MATKKSESRTNVEIRAESCAATLADARKTAAAKAAKLEEAKARHATKKGEHDAAKRAYLANPTDENARRKVHEARDDLHLLDAECEELANDVTEADRAVQTAERAAADADRELEQMREAAKNAAELAALRDEASLERFTKAAEPLSADLLALLLQARAKARALEALRSSVNAASAKLRARDEHVPDLDVVHLVAGMLRLRAGAEPTRVRGVVRGLDAIRHALMVGPGGAVGGLEQTLFGHIDPLLNGQIGSPVPADEASGDREDLEAHLTARTRHEAHERLMEAHRRRPQPAPPAPVSTERPGRHGPALFERVFGKS